MLQKIVLYFTDVFKNPVISIILKILSIVSVLSSCITVGGIFFYTVGYSFLYGYYFSGTMKQEINIVSLISLLIKNIPFPLYLVVTISIVFVTVIFFFLFLLHLLNLGIKQVVKKEERFHGIISLIIVFSGALSFQIALTSFFVEGLPSSNMYLRFSQIWIGPLIIAVSIYFIIRFAKGPFSSMSGIVYGIIGIGFMGAKLELAPSEVWLISLFAVAFMFSFFENLLKFLIYRLFLWLPLFFLITLIGLSKISFLRNITGQYKWILVISISISIAVLFAYFFGNKSKRQTKKEVGEQISKSAVKSKIGTVIILALASLISLLITVIPVISAFTGYYFRLLTPVTDRGEIVYDNDQRITQSTLVAKKEDTYYISSSDWTLIILKTDHFRLDDSK